MSDPADEYARQQTRQQMLVAMGITVAVALTGTSVCALALWDPVMHRVRGEVDLAGNPIYQPPFEVEAAVIGGIDFTKVHGKLLPDWMIAASYPDPRSQQVAADNLAALRAEAGKDKNLDALLVELSEIVADDPWANPERIDHLCWSWNHYLDDVEAPFWVDCTVMHNGQRGMFYTKSYAVLADMDVDVGEHTVRERIVRRIDQTNVVEMYHGKATTPDVGAVVLVDRIGEFATDDVWPRLDPADDDPWAVAVRDELGQALTGSQLAVLGRSAPERVKLLAAVRGIRERQSCGSRFAIAQLPYTGLSSAEHPRIRRFAEQSRGKRCPEVTEAEAEAIIEASLALQSDAELEPALEALAGFLARGVAVHEGRHVADSVVLGAADAELPCGPCDGQIGTSTRAELSAYLASFADEATSTTSLLQACDAMQGGGPHGAAMQFVLPQLLDAGCDEPPSDGLEERARGLEASLFGRSEGVELPDDFPAALPL